VQSEAVLADWQSRFGGSMVRLAVQRAEPVGGVLIIVGAAIAQGLVRIPRFART